MKVLIIDGNKDKGQVNVGLGFLLQYIRNDHEVAVLSMSFHNDDEILNSVSNYELVGFSSTSAQFPDCINLAKKIKENYNIPIVFGGIHATSCPGDVMENKQVDFICISEAEISFSLLLKEIEEKKYNFLEIPGLIYRDINNPSSHNADSYLPPKFINNLDEVGMPAWDLLEYDKGLKNVGIISSRGCPYQCAHCYNSVLHKIDGFRYRRRSVQSVIDECAYLKSIGINSFSFADDIFLIDANWISNFCILYKEKINLPFGCTARPEVIVPNIDLLKKLKDCGLNSIWMGIESGSDYIRRNILDRGMSNQLIIDAFRAVRNLGIVSKSYNMVGIPEESFLDALATFWINFMAKPNSTSYYTLIPYPGTKIAKIAQEKKLFGNRNKNYDDKINVQSKSEFGLGLLDTGKINRYHIVGFRYLWAFVFFRYSRKRIFFRAKFLFKAFKYFIIGFYKKIFYKRKDS